jgi:hypothetical protein
MKALGRCFLTTYLPAALIAAAMLWAMPAHAQGDTPKPSTAPPSTQPAPSNKSVSDIAPKAVLVDPCKVKNPPAYCGKH